MATKTALPNNYPGTCADCGGYVPALAGTRNKAGGTWLVHHLDGQHGAPLPAGVRPNRYQGTCPVCHGTVEAGAGQLLKDPDGKSFAQHLDGQHAAPAADRKARPEIPLGFYAVPSATGNNDLDFWQVKPGRTRGYFFVNRILGGHPPIRVSRPEQDAAYDAILAAGVEEAGNLYAAKTGECQRCRIELTDEASRALGLGETCAGYRGKDEEWHRIDRELKAARKLAEQAA